ncbi:MAG TPA: OsmC family peroxiredoxin [Vitreimonas sp.]|jgi:lipoyl-dependent peroxiredoxin|nr:OsmC family peroxiredoxin [Vitreimonas sp.]
MAQIRRADSTWNGDLLKGSGTIRSVTSGAFGDLPVTWAARTEAPEGKTSPEELVAAAHASCFSMALSNTLAKAGSPPEQLDVSAEITFDKLEPGWRVTRSALTVRGRVPGMSADAFREAAEAAKVGCPISNALNPSIELTVDASLEE